MLMLHSHHSRKLALIQASYRTSNAALDKKLYKSMTYVTGSQKDVAFDNRIAWEAPISDALRKIEVPRWGATPPHISLHIGAL